MSTDSANKRTTVQSTSAVELGAASGNMKKRSAVDADSPIMTTSSSKKQRSALDSSSAPTARELKAFKKKLVKRVVKAIKKTGHSGKNAPWTTVTEGIPSKMFASALFGDVGKVTKSTANTERRELHGHKRITKWLGLKEDEGLIHPVFFSGTYYHAKESKIHGVYAWGAIDELVVTVRSNLLRLKFRTHIHATGIPGHQTLCSGVPPIDGPSCGPDSDSDLASDSDSESEAA